MIKTRSSLPDEIRKKQLNSNGRFYHSLTFGFGLSMALFSRLDFTFCFSNECILISDALD